MQSFLNYFLKKIIFKTKKIMKPLTINPLPRVTSTRIKSVQAISLHKQLSPSHSSMSVRKKDLVYELAKNLNFIKKREKLNAE